ncbi:unnamed protein product [Phaedon cochleariae]|uniref:Carboxypeptidase n=1 Tax=Phaedon cochleariae TaxID=80249 RepID=A0A9P0GWT5_PHACE|nr:unnamed protein product [Phaedon cochleariae]
MKSFAGIFVLVISLHLAEPSFPNFYPKINSKEVTGDVGEPLFLTPFIEQNRIAEGQRAAEITLGDFKNVSSYSGYLTVDKMYNSNLFFWYFPAEINFQDAPVVLWLQGGPGATSLFALFSENGPFILKSPTEIEIREYRWSRDHSLIFIDNPAGTGFSFTEGGYAQNETKVGEDLYEALTQFFKLFPELQKNDFFVTGESYAGKYVPAISYTILQKNRHADLKINLQGLAIGNGLSDPENQLKYAEYLYQIGLVDLNTREVIREMEDQAKEYIRTNQFFKAFEIFDILLNGDLTNETTIFKNATGFDNYFNYLHAESTDSYLEEFLQRVDVRRALHVGNQTFHSGEDVEKHLVEDVMKSVAPWISELLENYRVLIYNGQLDIIVAYPLTLNYLQKLDFSGAKEYKTAIRNKWYSAGDLAGYVKQAGNLTEVLVRNAGHTAPSDQPEWMLDLISSFIRNIPLSRK